MGFVVADPEHSFFHPFFLTLIIPTTIYAAGALVSFIIDGSLKAMMPEQKLRKKIDALQGNCIVTGFSRMGRALCKQLSEKGEPFVLSEPFVLIKAARVVCPLVLSAGKVTAMTSSPLVDHPIANSHLRTRTGFTVVTVDRAEKWELNPTALFLRVAGDVLHLVGTSRSFELMKKFFGNTNSSND